MAPFASITSISMHFSTSLFFWHYHLTRMALIQPYRKVHAGCTGQMIVARMCMEISKRPGEEFKMFLGGKQLSQEMYFNYLGSIITQDGSCEKEMAVVEVELCIEYYVNY